MTEAGLFGGYKKAFFWLLLLQILFFYPFFLRGKILYPHDNAVDMGVRELSGGHYGQSDIVQQFIPALYHYAHTDSRYWPGGWDPSVQLGRPAMQLGALSPTYLPTRAVLFCTKDPRRAYTVLIVMTVFLAGAALFLFLRELVLHPAACFAAAAGFSMCFWVVKRLMVLTILSSVAWTAVLLWLVTRFVRRPSFGTAAGLAFAAQALLLSGYPQLIVIEGYLLGSWLVWQFLEKEGDNRARGKRLLAAACLMGLGGLLAAPVYADVAVRASAALRDSNLMSGAKLKVGFPLFLKHFLILGPFFFCLFWASLRPAGLRRWGLWFGFVLFCFLVNAVPAVRWTAVRYLGFHLSVDYLLTLFGCLIPIFVITAGALDAVVRRRDPAFTPRRMLVFLIVYGLTLAWFAARVFDRGYDPDGLLFYAMTFGILPMVYLFFARRSSFVLLFIVLASTFGLGHSWLPWHNPQKIHLTSPAVRMVQEASEGSRFAYVGDKRRRFLRANLAALYGLRSVHSFESLPSRRYMHWIESLGEINNQFPSDFLEKDEERIQRLSAAAVGTIVSDGPFSHPLFEKTAQSGDYAVYKALYPLRWQSQTSEEVEYSVRRLEEFHDRLVFETTDVPRPTLLFVSQQYHPQWRARAGEKVLKTVLVDGFFQGVRLPPHTQRVVLEYLTYSRWMWIPHLLFAGAAIACLAIFLRRKIFSRELKS